MAGVLYTGLNIPTVTNIAAGSTRWNTTTNSFEAFDGQQWMTMINERNETIQEMVQHLEDKIAIQIEEDYKTSSAIQDAFEAWEEANERFKIVLALAEKKC